MCAGSPDYDGTIIFMTASFSLDGRPRMVGPGVSATYQYEFMLWVEHQAVWLPSDGPTECTT